LKAEKAGWAVASSGKTSLMNPEKKKKPGHGCETKR